MYGPLEPPTVLVNMNRVIAHLLYKHILPMRDPKQYHVGYLALIDRDSRARGLTSYQSDSGTSKGDNRYFKTAAIVGETFISVVSLQLLS